MKTHFKIVSLTILSLLIASCGSSTHSSINTIKIATTFSSTIKDLNGTSKYITLRTHSNNKEDKRTTDIYYSVIPAKNFAHKKEPIFYLVGGPGGSATFSMDWILKDSYFNVLLNDHDLYIVDYRGTGFSKPFANCQLNTEGTKEELKESLQTCQSIMADANIKASDYSSQNIATDIQQIVKAEKIDKAIFYGTSYGTRIALTLAREYPDIVAGMILDGTFAIEANGISQASESVLEKLYDFKKNYNTIYTDRTFEQQLKLLSQLTKTQLLNIIHHAFSNFSYIAYNYESEENFIQMISELKNASKEQLYTFLLTDILSNIAYIKPGAKFMNELDEIKDISVNRKIAKIQKSHKIDSKYVSHQDGSVMSYSIILYEEYAFIEDQPLYNFGFNQTILDALDGYAGGAPLPIDKLDLVSKYFKTPLPNEIEMEPVSTDIPTLIFSGGRDMQTTKYWAMNTKKYLSNSQLFFFPLEGHVFSFENKNASSIVEKFLNHLDDITLLDDIKGEDFIREN